LLGVTILSLIFPTTAPLLHLCGTYRSFQTAETRVLEQGRYRCNGLDCSRSKLYSGGKDGQTTEIQCARGHYEGRAGRDYGCHLGCELHTLRSVRATFLPGPGLHFSTSRVCDCRIERPFLESTSSRSVKPLVLRT
jgi:hypothetical protein